MPLSNPASCTGSCADKVAQHISTWSSSSSSSSSSSGGANCGVNYGPRLLRVLTKNEFANSIKAITKVDVIADLGQSTFDAIPADNVFDGFSNNTMTNVEAGALQSYGFVVNKVVNKLLESDFADMIDCSGLDESGCGALFLEKYGQRIFRRNLSDEEVNTYSALFTSEYTAGDVNQGLALALRSMLTSPYFLYRDETGISIVEIKNGTSNTPEYEAVGELQSFVTASSPETVDLYGRVAFSPNYTGNDLIVITVSGVKGPTHGEWPTLSIESNGGTLAEVLVNHSYSKTYKFHITDLSGTAYTAFVNTNAGQHDPGKNLVISKLQVSAAQEKVPTLPAEDLDDDAYVLTQFQLASFLAFTFTGTTPDEVLLNAAAADELQTNAQIAAQIDRLLDTQQARKHFGDYATQWLKVGRILDIEKNSDTFPDFTPDVRAAMAMEVKEIFNHVVLDEGEPFTSLFDGNFIFANEILADFYGLGGVSGSGMQKISNVSSRAGLITSGAFLTVNAHEQDTAPILRAVRLRTRFLCHNVPLPPTGVSLSGDDFDEARQEAIEAWEAYLEENGGKATSRKKYEFQTSADLCMNCHEEMINPLGFGFEDFDAVGLPQSVDYNNLDVEYDGTLYGVNKVNGAESIAFEGAKQLAHELAGLDITRQCFIDNIFRLAMGTGSGYIDRTIEINLSDSEKERYGCEVEALDKQMKASDYSTRALLKAIGSMDSVRYRKDVQR